MRRILTLIVFILAFAVANASHIVGGDFYYEYLSGDKYRITMKLYVDCYNGIPGAISDDQNAYFGIFDAEDGTLIDTLKVERTGPIHLYGAVYKCVIDPGNVCVDQYNYLFDLDLPKRKGGYIIAFQRCCRNTTIKNIINPTYTGATYWVHVPDRNLVAVDNSPVFKKFPPIYVCNNFPLTFDHSAEDKDGDSLSYELYQPFLGANSTGPRPPLPKNPPYKNVVWSSPYSTADQMGGNPILAIDKLTGQLTVTPNTIGQFVIGVLVKQWRNGVLIGETLRDYQFNVVDCKASVVAIFKSFVNCSDTVNFSDLSVGATNISWDFGDPASGLSNNTSTLPNPRHIYTKNGEYTVTLKAWNSACEDEHTLKVIIAKQSRANFEIKDFNCINQVELIYNGSAYETILWDFGDGEKSEDPNPGIHHYKNSGSYTIRVITNAKAPCADTASKLVHIKGSPPDKFVPVNVFTPDGDMVNECFHFDGVLNECSEFKISIYNRWGMKIFETKDFNACWNGRIDNKGEMCPEGTYFYICEYKGESPNIKPRFSGTITLIRM
jgi:gliding motility-associated-like protein